jgi:hypothetical protein
MHSVVGGNGTVKKLTTSLRAFLRYLAVKGRCRAGLAESFLAMPIGGLPTCRDIWRRSK